MRGELREVGASSQEKYMRWKQREEMWRICGEVGKVMRIRKGGSMEKFEGGCGRNNGM